MVGGGALESTLAFFSCSGKMTKKHLTWLKGSMRNSNHGGKKVSGKKVLRGRTFLLWDVEILDQFRRKYWIKFEDRVSLSSDVYHLVPRKKKKKEIKVQTVLVY